MSPSCLNCGLKQLMHTSDYQLCPKHSTQFKPNASGERPLSKPKPYGRIVAEYLTTRDWLVCDISPELNFFVNPIFSEKEIQERLTAMETARKARDFKRADIIRSELFDAGITVANPKV